MESVLKRSSFHDIYFRDGKDNISSVVREETETGGGEMVCYDVAHGIQITYNELNMGSCYRPIIPEHDFLQIDHCLEGCYECESADGTVTFLGEGDLSVGSLYEGKQTIIGSNIPLKKYKGITVLFEIEKAQKAISENFGQADINVKKIRDTLCSNGTLLLVKSKREIDHIFGELYSVDKRIQSPYFWIKTIELLLFLSLLDGTAMQKLQHFSEDISKRTQKVYQYIIENPFDIKTIADLSEEFGIAESSLKRCFKSFTSLLDVFVDPVNKLVGFIQKIQTLKADMSRVEDIMRYGQDEKFIPSKRQVVMTSKLSGDVELCDIALGYSILEKPLVEHFSFHLESGRSIAFGGASGCGKSTVSKIVSGLYLPWEGE